ncbi:unnamed protein product (mitochondrion) [Plasmodiophora brassicae]|uniref:Ribosome quality control complex subunit 2 n=1 Tax=Plasmodiophora brassicae TaxID=37360 RepID=A0A3P3Y4E8_PLABS|nr:unnamed protein product [Plasmodiophora brassicae]
MGKGHLASFEVAAAVAELVGALAGCRLTNVYDLGPRTYLFKFGRPGGYKAFLIIESGVRFHLTAFERETNPTPNTFAIKLRKHLRTKRLDGIRQCGFDRVLQLTFGTGTHAYHLFVELHSGGNIILTDSGLIILSLLRPYETPQAGKVAVRERYPIELSAELPAVPSEISLDSPTKGILSTCTEQVIEIISAVNDWIARIRSSQTVSPGYIFKKDGKNVEFSPFVLHEHEGRERDDFPTFNEAMDAFFSNIESDQKVQQSVKTEKKVMSKEEKMRRDIEQRVSNLASVSEKNERVAELIMTNLELVDNAITAMRGEIASGADWRELERVLAEEKRIGLNPIAQCIKSLHFDRNAITIILGEKGTPVEVDLALSAHANANVYFDAKKKAGSKSQRTLAAADVAIRNAVLHSEKAMKKALKKGIVGAQSLHLRRKPHWFEKFHWFITSDNFMVIGGRDAQQNELVVRRHLNANDLYFHADLHGASSVVLLNPDNVQPIPPRSLEEAAAFTICRSAAWESRTVISAYWVHADQVSKTAPTGMFITTGSFMIRGKRNYMPPSQLLMGLTFLFRVSDADIANHVHERSSIGNGDVDDNAEVQSDREEAALFEEATVDDGGVEPDTEVEPQEVSVQPREPSPVGFDVTSSLVKSAAAFDMSAREAVVDDADAKDKEADDNAEDDDLVNTAMFDTQSAKARGKSRMSARQRRLLRKGGASDEMSTEDGTRPSDTVVEPVASTPAEPPDVLPRGKRTKMKRLKKRYADQDEEEREQRLRLLGSSGVRDLHGTAEKDAESDVDDEKENGDDDSESSEDASATAAPEQDWIVKVCFHCHGQGHVVRECPELVGADQKTLNKAVQSGRDLEREQLKDLAKEESAAQEQFNLHCLTGNPITSDTILYALPMCAPYSVVRNNRFRVKVVPGAEKRGQSAKASVSLVMRMCSGDDADRIKDALKAVNDNDIAITLPAGTKVSAPGLAAVASSGKGKPPKKNRGPKKKKR